MRGEQGREGKEREERVERKKRERKEREKRRAGTGRLKQLLFSLGPTGAAVRTNAP